MKKATLILLFFSYLAISFAQSENTLPQKEPLKIKLNESGSHYIKANVMAQVWLRYTDNNPGSLVFGDPVDNIFDIGIRRARFQLQGQLTDKVFFYTQFGQNNISNLSPQQTGAFFHDIVVDYTAVKRALSFGTGLTAMGGFSRYSTPSTGSALTLDVPQYQQATNGANDQFGRKLAIYAKGKLGKLDYRLTLARPFAIQKALAPIGPLSKNADFSPKYAHLQTSGYFMYQFFDEESNSTHNISGTYLGTKKVFNIGVGFMNQPKAMRYTNSLNDTVYTKMQLFGLDFFYEEPINKEKGTALTAYLALNYFDFGPGYIRNVGVMNPTNGNSSPTAFSGSGNSLPLIGTGSTVYGQLGYLLKNNLLPNNGKLQPYIACQLSKYERLKDNMLMVEGGFNWYIHGVQGSKISLNCQSRPVYQTQLNGDNTVTSRKVSAELQYQVAF